MLGNGPADLTDLLRTFISDVLHLLEQMQLAAASGDVGTLRRLAYGLKSNARDVAATALGGLCAWLEGDLRDGRDGGDLNYCVSALHDEWRSVRGRTDTADCKTGGQALTDSAQVLGVDATARVRTHNQ